MPTATYIALANLTLSSGQQEITFSSIPATYRDLVVVIEGTSTAGDNAVNFKMNGVTTDMSYVQMIGTGSTTISNSTTVGSCGAMFTARSMIVINIMDYAATDKHKTVLSRSSIAAGDVRAFAARWGSTNAMTSFAVYTNNNQFATGTTFALYGIVS